MPDTRCAVPCEGYEEFLLDYFLKPVTSVHKVRCEVACDFAEGMCRHLSFWRPIPLAERQVFIGHERPTPSIW